MGYPLAMRLLRHALALVLLTELVLTATATVQMWPAVDAAAQRPEDGSAPVIPVVHVLGVFSGAPDPESAFMVIVLLLGCVGASVHALSSLGDYFGNGTFHPRWTWWYLFRVPVGASIALVFYLLLRGGLISADAGVTVINPYAIAALAGLSGMFAKAAGDKLEEVWKTLFRTAGGAGDEQRGDKLLDPRVERAEPPALQVGAVNPEITLYGAGFGPGTTVTIGGTTRGVDLVGPDQLTVRLLAEDVAQPGLLQLVVRDTASPNRGPATFPIEIRPA